MVYNYSLTRISWISTLTKYGQDTKTLISEAMTEEEKQRIREQLEELKLEHRDLDEAIHHMTKTIHTQMQISRLKKRKLCLKDEIIKLENILIPDILA